MRSQNTWLPAVHRIQVLRPLISSSASRMPPSICLKTSSAASGKSAAVNPAALASSGGYCGERLQAATQQSREAEASTESPRWSTWRARGSELQREVDQPLLAPVHLPEIQAGPDLAD